MEDVALPQERERPATVCRRPGAPDEEGISMATALYAFGTPLSANGKQADSHRATTDGCDYNCTMHHVP
jgi:hypothetical protein